jgi:hypothetical protein
MKASQNVFFHRLGMFLLAIWLIATGLVPLLNVSFPASDLVLPLLAAAAGLLLLLSLQSKFSKNWGVVLLASWLIATALLSLLNISFPASGTILAILAIAAGILLLLKR